MREVELLTRSKRSVNYDWPMITSYRVTITVREMWIIMLKILNDLEYIDFIHLNCRLKREIIAVMAILMQYLNLRLKKIRLTFILER